MGAMSRGLFFIAAFSMAAAGRPHKKSSLAPGVGEKDVNHITRLTGSGDMSSTAGLEDTTPHEQSSLAKVTGKRDVNDITKLTALSDVSSAAGVEDTLMALLASGAANTPTLKPFVESIEELMDREMKPKILENRNTVQGNVKTFLATFSRCPTDLATAQSDVDKEKFKFAIASAAHKLCRTTQSSQATASDVCTADRIKAEADEKEKCGLVQGLEDSKNSQSCDARGSETYGEMAARLKTQMALAESDYLQKKNNCDVARGRVAQKKAQCTAGSKVLAEKKSECDNIQGQMDSSSCSYVTRQATACEALDACYNQALADYETACDTAEVQEASFKTEMKIIFQLQCYTKVLSGGASVPVAPEEQSKWRDAEIEKCKVADYTSEIAKLNVEYPPPPKKPSCTVPSDGAGSGTYKRNEYDILKTNHKDAQAATCAAPCCQDDVGLLAYYPLTDALSGPTLCKDASGRGRDAQAAGTGTVGPSGKFSGGSYCQADWAKTQNWGDTLSVCARFQRTSTANTDRFMGIVSNGYSSNGAWEIRMGRADCRRKEGSFVETSFEEADRVEIPENGTTWEGPPSLVALDDGTSIPRACQDEFQNRCGIINGFEVICAAGNSCSRWNWCGSSSLHHSTAAATFSNNAGGACSCRDLGGGVRTTASPVTWDATGHPAALGEWVHVCMTYDGKARANNFYVNGALASSNSADSGAIISAGKPIYIGIADVDAVGSQQWFDGFIQHVRVYSRALSATDVRRIFASDK